MYVPMYTHQVPAYTRQAGVRVSYRQAHERRARTHKQTRTRQCVSQTPHRHAQPARRDPLSYQSARAHRRPSGRRARLRLCLYPRASRFVRSSPGVCAPGSDARDQAGGRDQAARILRRRVGTRPSGPPARWPAPCAGPGPGSEPRPGPLLGPGDAVDAGSFSLKVLGRAGRVGPVGPDAISPTPAAAGDRGATSGLRSPPQPCQCPRPTPGGTGAHIRVTRATSCARRPCARAGARGVVIQLARSARRRRGPASPLLAGSPSRGRVP